jgi:2,5-dihydroxypyridine 5,6-dioxygenase
MRQQELNPAKLPLLFKKELELCKVKPGNLVVMVTDLTTRQDYVQAAFAAGQDLGAKIFELRIPTPFAAGMIASYGGGDTLLNLPSAIQAIEAADLVLVFHISLGSTWMQQARKKGVRILIIMDGPDELERLMSPAGLKEAVIYTRDLFRRSKELRVTSEAGTDFRASLGKLNTVCQYGYADEPGVVDTWGAAHVSSWPDPGSSEGTIVLQPGDSWILPYVRYIEQRVVLTIEKGAVRKVDGDGVDARLFTEFSDAFKKNPADIEPYCVSHLGWGMHPNSMFNQIAIYGNDLERIASDGRTWPGVFLFSTGPDDQGGGKNSTPCHIDLPMLGCTCALDGRTVIDRGVIVDERMLVKSKYERQIAA